MSFWDKLRAAATGEKPEPEAEEYSGPKCPKCGNENLIDVTCLGDVRQKLLCGNCGCHSESTSMFGATAT